MKVFDVIDKKQLYRELDLKLAYERFQRFFCEGKRSRARRMAWYIYNTHGVDLEFDDGRDLIGWSKNY
jgi:hypothetical protein